MTAATTARSSGSSTLQMTIALRLRIKLRHPQDVCVRAQSHFAGDAGKGLDDFEAASQHFFTGLLAAVGALAKEGFERGFWTGEFFQLNPSIGIQSDGFAYQAHRD